MTSSVQRPPTTTELGVHRAVLGALEPYGADSAAADWAWSDRAGMWFTDVRPARPSAAALSVAVDGQDDELNITVSRTWLEVWGVDDLASWAFDFAEAVFAGKLEEAGFGSDRFVRVFTRHGVESAGRVHLPLPWRWRRVRRFLPYADVPRS